MVFSDLDRKPRMMTRGFHVLGALLLGASLIVNLIEVQAVLATRLPADRLIGARKHSTVRRSMIYGAEAGQLIGDLERAVLEARSQGHERIVLSYTGKFSNVLMSSAIHVGWPMQVIAQTTPGMKRAERLAKAAKRGATLFLSLRPGQGWTAVPVTPDMAGPTGSNKQ